jgi:ligand-binding sensor domain-containing protein/serine phosphatase RsbU (regulator of sigma subunit)
MRKFYTLFILFLMTYALYGQSFKFIKYAEHDGLNNRFVYTLDQDEWGNLMIGTGEGLYIHDGSKFQEISEEQGLSDNFLTCSSPGKQGAVWYGHNKGLITKYINHHFEHFDISSYTQSRINSIYEDELGNLWVLTQNDGLLKKSTEGKWSQFKKGIEEFTLYSFVIDDKQTIWLGTDIGLLKANISGEDAIEYDWIEEIIETKVSSLTKHNNTIYAGTEDSGIFQIRSANNSLEILPILFKGQELKDLSINYIFTEKENTIWLCTNNKGLIQLSRPVANDYFKLVRYRDKSQLKTSSVRICASDREGTIWVGTMGDGLLKLTDDYFSINTFDDIRGANEIYSIHEQNDSIWCGVNGKIYLSVEEPNNIIDSIDHNLGLSSSPVTAIYVDKNKSIWTGNAIGELKILHKGAKKLKLISIGTELQDQQINDINGYGDFVYVATDFGIFQFRDNKLFAHLTVQSGLPHNVVKSLFIDSEGRIWLSTSNSQLTYIEQGEIKGAPVPFENALIQIRCITEDNSGNIWFGTDGLGVIKKSVNNEISVYNKNSGLYSDYCYSIGSDQRNKLWIGHHGAISKLNILNNEIEIIDPGTGNEIDFLDNSIVKLPSGIVLFGTSQGVLRYEPEKDQKNDQEPILHFLNIQINDSNIVDFKSVQLPYGSYKFEFNFIGVSLKNPKEVSYQYMLEGYENEWSNYSGSHIQDYNKLSSGEYTFKVKCYNSDGYGGTQILEYKIFIDKPFWLKWWFMLLSGAVFVLLVRYLILRRERNLREAQERLKIALDERTKEVVDQKELLEEKNKDIMDSILYARNIQNALLPSNDALNQYFMDSLVYYKPRDIVSGDFYWVEQFDETIVVSCADCTGHGVPGAFMSLIGSTLLKEVSNKKSVQCSRDVLLHLDNELNRMLRKQVDVAIQDGMDIAVFDYNLKTRVIKIASANRPVLFYHKNEWHELRGDRQSIGGSFEGKSKTFNQYEFAVEPGDMIYLFSDGITDQFGGLKNKKLKRSGLLGWLKDVTHLSMREQRDILKSNFHQWKGDREQLDDIILIGIRF